MRTGSTANTREGCSRACERSPDAALARARRVRYGHAMRLAYHVMSSPLGLLFIVAGERGLKHLEFMDRKSIKRMIAAHATRYPETTWEPSLLEIRSVVDQLEGYFCGASTTFDVALDQDGTDFQRLVWRELLRIPYGETRTYGQIAKAIGQP